MKRSPELEAMTAADETAVSNRNAGRNQTIGMAALLLGGAVAAYFVLATAGEKPRDVVDRSSRRRPSGRRHSCVSKKSRSRR